MSLESLRKIKIPNCKFQIDSGVHKGSFFSWKELKKTLDHAMEVNYTWQRVWSLWALEGKNGRWEAYWLETYTLDSGKLTRLGKLARSNSLGLLKTNLSRIPFQGAKRICNNWNKDNHRTWTSRVYSFILQLRPKSTYEDKSTLFMLAKKITAS